MSVFNKGGKETARKNPTLVVTNLLLLLLLPPTTF
jgi:hypothetical protein